MEFPEEKVQEKKNPAFLTKTFEMLQTPEYEDIIIWSTANSFLVVNPERMCRELLPRYFKHSKFSSFVRQLHIYGFHKINASRWEFSHPCFLPGREDLLQQIQRNDSSKRESRSRKKKADLLNEMKATEGEIGQLRGQNAALIEQLRDSRNKQLELHGLLTSVLQQLSNLCTEGQGNESQLLPVYGRPPTPHPRSNPDGPTVGDTQVVQELLSYLEDAQYPPKMEPMAGCGSDFPSDLPEEEMTNLQSTAGTLLQAVNHLLTGAPAPTGPAPVGLAGPDPRQSFTSTCTSSSEPDSEPEAFCSGAQPIPIPPVQDQDGYGMYSDRLDSTMDSDEYPFDSASSLDDTFVVDGPADDQYDMPMHIALGIDGDMSSIPAPEPTYGFMMR